MKELAQEYISKGSMVITDFICPTFKTRSEFNADLLIFMDTITLEDMMIQTNYLKNQKNMTF